MQRGALHLHFAHDYCRTSTITTSSNRNYYCHTVTTNTSTTHLCGRPVWCAANQWSAHCSGTPVACTGSPLHNSNRV